MGLPLARTDASRGLAVDAGALADLKTRSHSAPQQALRAAASQFEALFLQNLMKSMRQAMPADGPFDSDASRTYTEMLDTQLAQTLAKKGTGIADMLVKQLAHALGTPAADTPSAAPTAFRPLAPTPMPPSQGAAKMTAPVAAAAAPTGGGFIDRMRPYAEAAAQAMGVPANYLLAQAGLETGWGRSQPRAADGTASHNLFGIKAGRNWKGAVVEAPTTEYVGGKPVTSFEKFRAYGTPGEAFRDFAALISRNPRYSAVVGSSTAEGYADGMQRAGYATDPAYARKLAQAIATVDRHAPRPVRAEAPQVRADAADIRSAAA